MNISIHECAQNLLTALNSPENSKLHNALDSLPTASGADPRDTHSQEQFDILFAVADDLRQAASLHPPVPNAPGRRAAITDILRQLSLNAPI